MLRLVTVIVLATLSASCTAQQSFSYNYIQGAYGRVDVDNPAFDADGEGLGISGSFEIDEHFHVFGEFQTANLNFGADFDLKEIGAGYHTNISPRTDLYANIGLVDVETGGSAGDDGVMFGLGLRGHMSPVVELYGGLDYIDFDNFDSETRANAGFQLALTDNLGVGLKASLWDDFNIFQINARLYFE